VPELPLAQEDEGYLAIDLFDEGIHHKHASSCRVFCAHTLGPMCHSQGLSASCCCCMAAIRHHPLKEADVVVLLQCVQGNHGLWLQLLNACKLIAG
jgi:hypothetical protein